MIRAGWFTSLRTVAVSRRIRKKVIKVSINPMMTPTTRTGMTTIPDGIL